MTKLTLNPGGLLQPNRRSLQPYR